MSEEKKYIILRGNESPQERNSLKEEYNGNVELLPSCSEITPLGNGLCQISVNGAVIACCLGKNILM